MSMLNNLMRMLNGIHKISETLVSELQKVVILQRLPKGTCLLQPGMICTRLYFIEKGLVRTYSMENSDEVTLWFTKENEFAFSAQSFLAQTPSFEYIELLEDCILFYIEYDELERLYSKYFEMNYISRIKYQQAVVLQAERVNLLMSKTAKEKLNLFAEEQAEIYRRVPLKHIASYLGLNPCTISRIRSEKD